MNKFLYQKRCRCKEEFSIIKKRNVRKKRKEKLLPYPNSSELTAQTFRIKYQKKLSFTAKSVLNSFQKKYLYYAIDDILYSLKKNVSEQKDLLALLYSPIISLQNNFSINFFDIWIQEIYIDEIFKTNKFLRNDVQILEPASYITITLFYRKKALPKKKEFLW